MKLKLRKPNRLENYDYSQNGAYFITICVKDRKPILSKIVGTPVPTDSNIIINNKNSIIAKFVSTFKRFCNKEFGNNIWQSRYYDHVIRNQDDYNEIFQYIDNNTKKWALKNQDD